jgi:hypothetical protein
MPEINGPVADFAKSKGATTISPLTSPGPNQRGPTCGFYALGFVMQYWYERQVATGENQNLTAPLPVRTHATPQAEQAGFFGKTAKSAYAMIGTYSSLRHYGKYNKLTAYGSVFNAESMVKIAKGQGAQYGGQFSGHVLVTGDASDLVARTKLLLAKECPLIIPFDVGDDGDPGNSWSGERAHWAVIVGYYSDASEDYFIHYHWGKYRHAKAQAFADSNYSLTSNKIVTFQKVEVRRPDGVVTRRDYQGPSFSSQVPGLTQKGFKVKNLGGHVQNLELNNPVRIKLQGENARGVLESHGFDPDHLANNGLFKKLVAVYPQRLQAQLSVL